MVAQRKKGAGVSLFLRGKTVSAFAEAELNEKAVEARMFDYVRHMPMAAKSLGVRLENKTPNPEDIRCVAKKRS